MTAAHTLALALLAACSLRPYTFDTDTGHANATSSDGTTFSTTTPGPTSTTTASLTSTTDVATGSDSIVGEWRGRYYIADEKDEYEPRFSPCTADLAWNFHSDAVPALCKDYDPNDPSLNLHVAGILHPDGDDADDLAELEVTAILAGPCAIGTCDAPSEWSVCRPWAEVCLGCDTYQQDCPEGQKCAPYSADGAGGWESVRCVPVAPAPGGTDAPCTAEGDGLIGIDTCAKGHLCAHIDPDTEMGKCVPQCTGSPMDPTCPACRTCTITSNGALTLCLPDCTPVAPIVPDLPAECVCNHEQCGEVLCGKVELSVACSDASKVKDVLGLQCALTALRDRTPGRLEWEENWHCGFEVVRATVSIADDATAIVQQTGWADCSKWTGPINYGLLREPDFFTNCLGEPDPVKAFECLRDALAAGARECAPVRDGPPCGP